MVTIIICTVTTKILNSLVKELTHTILTFTYMHTYIMWDEKLTYGDSMTTTIVTKHSSDAL